MDIVKKNLVSILCGVIALVSIIVIYFPLGGMYAKMSQQLQSSAKTGTDMQAVEKQTRAWPSLNASESGKYPLKHFPTAAIYKVGEDITKSWAQQATDLINAATAPQEARLKPLVEGALPGGTGQQQPAYKFMYAYLDLFKAATATPANPSATPAGTDAVPEVDMKPVSLLGTRLFGRMPPTQADIQNVQKSDEASINNKIQRDTAGTVINQDAIDKEIAADKTSVGDRLRSDVALKSMIYADPALSFVYYPRISGNTAPAADDIFLAQVGLWLQQEVCDAIYSVDKDAKQGVVDAPIKRLVGIRFNLPYVPPAATNAPGVPGAPAAAPATPPAVPPMPTAKIAQDFNKGPFGHISNDLYDVLPYRVQLVCDAESLPDTLTRLTTGRYFTVRNISVQAVDAGLAYAQGYLYGSKKVVQVTLDVEWLLLRKVSGPLMPPDIVTSLATLNTAGQPGQPG